VATPTDRLRQEIAWRKAKSDVLWASTLWWIQHPRGSRLWELYPAQEEILSLWASGEHALHLKARQLGFSTSVGFFAWWVAFFNADAKILLLSKGERESAELLEKVKFGLERLPEWLKHRGPKVVSQTQSRLTFDNGSEILSLPSANNPARGFSGRLIVVDEWAFLPNGDEAWAAIEPTADIGGQIIGLSTANGIGNVFHTLWEKATKGKSMFTAVFYPWSAVPSRDRDWYELKSENMLPWQLHQEYPEDADEAFIRSGATVFDITDLRARTTVDGDRFRLMSPDSNLVWLQPSPGGEVTIFERPQTLRAYVLGVDVAEGLGHGDFSSIHVVDVVTRSVVATWHGRIPADLLAEQIYGLGTLYGRGLVLVEANNHGLTTITALRRLRYPRIWRRRELNTVNNQMSVNFGFKTSRYSKPVLIDGLGAWLREQREINCKGTISELMSYVRADNGSMGGSPHDDRVMSLALAVMALEYANQPEYRVEVDDTGTFEYWGRMADEHNKAPVKVDVIRPLRERMRVSTN